MQLLSVTFHPVHHLLTLSLSATNFRQIKRINRVSLGPQSLFIFLFPITPHYGWSGKVPSNQQWVTSRHPQVCGLHYSGINVKYVGANLVIFTTAI